MESLAREYCAYTVAIVIVLHPIVKTLGLGQLSPNDLSVEVNNSEYSVSPDFAVNPLALHQGFHLFKKSIRKLGHTMIQMGCKGIPSVAEFMDLPEAEIGWDIVFFHSDQELLTNSEIMLKVTTNAHYFMRQKGSVAQYSSLSEIGAVLWQRQLPTCRPPPIVSPIIQKTPDIVHHKRRKCSNELAGRQLSNCGKKVIKMVSSQLCVNNEDPLGYLIAAIKETRNPYGPASVKLVVLVDRGGRELPVQPDLAMARVALPAAQSLALARLPNGSFMFEVQEK